MSRSPAKRAGGAATLRRTTARLLAVQALYQARMTGHAADRVIDEFLSFRLEQDFDGVPLSEADRNFFRDLVQGTCKVEEDLDNMIAAVLDEEWTVERLENLLLVLLRAGVFELTERPDIPARVVITEYVDLANAFFSGKEPAMVNGILDGLARSLRIEEFEGNAAR